MPTKDSKYTVSIEIKVQEIGKEEKPMYEHKDAWNGADYGQAVLLEEILADAVKGIYDKTIALGYEGAELIGIDMPGKK